jgi:hypothetical protein
MMQSSAYFALRVHRFRQESVMYLVESLASKFLRITDNLPTLYII